MTLRNNYVHPLLVHIAARRLDLRHQWEEGTLTTDEVFAAFDALSQEERNVYRQLDFAHFTVERGPRERRHMWTGVAAAFVVGFLVSPYLYPKLFGYRSAEECALNNSTRIGYAMCFDLYESKDARQVPIPDSSRFIPMDPSEAAKYVPVEQAPSSSKDKRYDPAGVEIARGNKD